MTAAKVELGRMLFFDLRLSRDVSMSCASCHQPELAFSNGPARAVGITGEVHPRDVPSLANTAYSPRYTWAHPGLRTLEAQARGPLFGEGTPIVEMGLSTETDRQQALDRLRADSRYLEAFAAAFPEERDRFRFELVIDALASFQRTLISGNSPWDRFRRGETEALSDAARRGARIFFGHETPAVCHHCHDGFNLSSQTAHRDQPFDEVGFFNVGLYDVDGTGSYPEGNQGLFEHTADPADRGRFRTPTLRNVAITAPYMHDGSVATLEEVVDIYDRGGRLVESGPHAGDGRDSQLKDAAMRPMGLFDDEKTDLVEFLEALTDRDFIEDPELRNPFPTDPNFGP
jgi:cytochrome c peroxidase